MNRSLRTRYGAVSTAKTGKPPDTNSAATQRKQAPNPAAPNANPGVGSTWRAYPTANQRVGKNLLSPSELAVQNAAARAAANASPNTKGKTPSSGRLWAKKVGKFTAARVLKKAKSTPITPQPIENGLETGRHLLKRSGSVDAPPPPPLLMCKPSHEVLSNEAREILLEKASCSVLGQQPELPELQSPEKENINEQVISADQAPKDSEPQSVKEAHNPCDASFPPVAAISAPLFSAKGSKPNYTPSDDSDTELPALNPLKRGKRLRRTQASYNMREDSGEVKNRNIAEQRKDKHHLRTKGKPPGKTASPAWSTHPATRIAQDSRNKNKNVYSLDSTIHFSPISASPNAYVEKPLPEIPCPERYPETAKTVPAKRMSGGRPPIPYRSDKRFSSSPSSVALPRPNDKATTHIQSAARKVEVSATPERSNTQTGGNSSKETKVAHITPRNVAAMSRIPQPSPLALTSAAAGSGTPDSSAKSPLYVDRRSSIPIPKRMLEIKTNDSETTIENDSSALKEDKSAVQETYIKREDDSDGDGNEEVKIFQASQVSLHKVGRSYVERNSGKDSDASDNEKGYRVKRLSVTGHGPTLRISASADKIIMGHGAEKENSPIEKVKANSERRHSWNPMELGLKEKTFSKQNIKSILSPRSVSSLGSALRKDKLTGSEGKELKKAKSADLRSLASSRSSPGSEAGKTETRRVYNGPLFNPERASHRPSALREGLDTSTPVSRKSASVSFKEGTKQSKQSRLSRVSTGRNSTPTMDHGTLRKKDAKNNDSPCTGRVPRRVGSKIESVSRTVSTASKKQTPNATPPERPPRGSSRTPAPDHTLSAKSKLAHVKNASSVSNTVTKNNPVAMEPREFGLNEGASPTVNRDSLATSTLVAGSLKTRTSNTKNSLSRGMFSNFKGLFGKPKAGDGFPESSTSRSLRPKLSTTFSRNKTSRETIANTRSIGARLPSENSTRSLFGRGNRSTRPSIVPLRFPQLEFPGNGDVNALTRDILESAQRETDSSVKLRLIKLGRILVEAINHSNDAEKSMIEAMHAAKQAEVYSTMTKQNVMQLGLAVQELRNRSSGIFQASPNYDPSNVI